MDKDKYTVENWLNRKYGIRYKGDLRKLREIVIKAYPATAINELNGVHLLYFANPKLDKWDCADSKSKVKGIDDWVSENDVVF